MSLRSRNKALCLFTLCVGLLLGACGNSTIKAMEEAKNKVCACKDKKCAKKVMKANKALEAKVKDLPNVEKAKALGLFKEGQACYKKLKK